MTEATTQQTTQPSGTTSDYSPSPGDVVTFKYSMESLTGIVGPDSGTWMIAALFNFPDASMGGFSKSMIRDLEFTGETIAGIVKWEDATDAAKAYFAQASKPVFKVGDKVRVVKNHPDMNPKIGDTSVVERIDGDGDVWLKGVGCCYSNCLALATFTPDPDKSYAENQAAWVEFHGLEVGSKVKVVRKASSKEDGWDMYWNSQQRCVGEVMSLENLDLGDCGLEVKSQSISSEHVPYFALEPA